MQIPGTLAINDNKKESRLDGSLLAVQGSASPMGDATAFLENNGFRDGQRVVIAGDRGQLGNLDVIFMINAAAGATAAAGSVTH
jgi:hypothetical protein